MEKPSTLKKIENSQSQLTPNIRGRLMKKLKEVNEGGETNFSVEYLCYMSHDKSYDGFMLYEFEGTIFKESSNFESIEDLEGYLNKL